LIHFYKRELARMLRRPSSMDLASWTIFSLLDNEFSAQINLPVSLAILETRH
jgi:hypothetical protein